MLALIELNKTQPSTSELMALSVGTNPVVIRQLMSSLKRARTNRNTKTVSPAVIWQNRQQKLHCGKFIWLYRKKQMHRSLTFMPIPIRTVLSGAISVKPWTHRFGMPRLAMEQTLETYTLKDVADNIARHL